MGLPVEITDCNWDIIYVDSPQGYRDSDHGRMQSIYSASKLNHTHILVHDCDRALERSYFNEYIGEPTTIEGKLFHKEEQK